MKLPDYWLERPAPGIDVPVRRAFDRLLKAALAGSEGSAIDYALPFPRWQFLCHVAEEHDVALHGSGNPDIALFEPRPAVDLNPFGRQKAVYAASDGIWAMFFAIADRDRHQMIVNNACIRLVDGAGQVSGPYYFFSVSRQALARRPWRAGTVYLLPRATFAPQPALPFGTAHVQVAQLASPQPVQPLARLAVAPGDFPFLDQVRGHDDERLEEYATALQTGAPWPDEP